MALPASPSTRSQQRPQRTDQGRDDTDEDEEERHHATTSGRPPRHRVSRPRPRPFQAVLQAIRRPTTRSSPAVQHCRAQLAIIPLMPSRRCAPAAFLHHHAKTPVGICSRAPTRARRWRRGKPAVGLVSKRRAFELKSRKGAAVAGKKLATKHQAARAPATHLSVETHTYRTGPETCPPTRSKVCVAYSLAETKRPRKPAMPGQRTWPQRADPKIVASRAERLDARGGRAADALGPHRSKGKSPPAQALAEIAEAAHRLQSSWSSSPKTSELSRASSRRRA